MPARRYVALAGGQGGRASTRSERRRRDGRSRRLHRPSLRSEQAQDATTVSRGVQQFPDILHRREDAVPAGRQVDHRRAPAPCPTAPTRRRQAGEREDAEDGGPGSEGGPGGRMETDVPRSRGGSSAISFTIRTITAWI